MIRFVLTAEDEYVSAEHIIKIKKLHLQFPQEAWHVKAHLIDGSEFVVAQDIPDLTQANAILTWFAHAIITSQELYIAIPPFYDLNGRPIYPASPPPISSEGT